MPPYYPPVGFHFLVHVHGLQPSDFDLRFTEVGGLSVEMTTEEVPEGGQNRFVQKFPVRAKYPELVLKRGLLVGSQLHDWIHDAVENFMIIPRDIDIILLNDLHLPLMTWHLVNAYPTKWSVSDLSATNNAIVVESLQFFYQSFTLDRTLSVAGSLSLLR
ncbi:MAG: phage tail protein [Gemmatimonadaceae bacterium]